MIYINHKNRKKLRLSYYDYSKQGFYFLTFNTYNREEILCSIKRSTTNECRIELSKFGKIVSKYIQRENEVQNTAEIISCVVMPNHVHMIVYVNDVRNQADTIQHKTIPNIISTIKRLSSKEAGFSLWQRSYYDRIIRNDEELTRALEYISENPRRWLNEHDAD